MASIQSPATLLILLKKAKTTYQKKKPDLKSKPEIRHKEIVKDIQRLKEMARKKNGPEGPKLVKPFNARKKILLKKLTEQRKKINSATEKNADQNKAQLPAYTKALMKLTTSLMRLEFAKATADEETVNLDALEEGDPAELDKLDALSDADLAALEKEDDAALPEASGEEEGGEHDEQEVPKAPPEPGKKPTTAPPDGVSVLKRFMALSAEYNTAIAKPGAHVALLKTQHDKARGFIDGKDFAQAAKAIDGLEALMAKVKSGGTEDEAPKANGALGAWQTARTAAIGKLKGLASEIAASKDPDSGQALILLNSIIKNLPLSPTTPQQIKELESYLTQDDVISDACLAFDVRSPLLQAIAGLKS